MFRNFLKRRKLVLGIVVALIAAAMGGPVYAHVIYEFGHTYSSHYNCTWSRAEISHGGGGGYSKAHVKSEWNRSKKTCYQRLTVPIKHIRAKWVLYKKNGQSWETCVRSNYWYNGRSASELKNWQNHGSSPPCGAGEYMTEAFTGVKIGTWYGQPIESGVYGHQLP